MKRTPTSLVITVALTFLGVAATAGAEWNTNWTGWSSSSQQSVQSQTNLGNDSQATEEVHQFVVEFTCGTNDDGFARIVPGDYGTVINVYNAGAEARTRAKVSLSFPEGMLSDWRTTTFAPMEARQLDCADILRGGFMFPMPLPSSPYYQGFVVIQTKGTQDVVARYTAAGPVDGEVTNDVETIEPRTIVRVVPDDSALVTICHVPPGNPSNAHTIEVGESAVPAHIAHGDHEGACD